jgi:hypothetical protein
VASKAKIAGQQKTRQLNERAGSLGLELNYFSFISL